MIKLLLKLNMQKFHLSLSWKKVVPAGRPSSAQSGTLSQREKDLLARSLLIISNSRNHYAVLFYVVIYARVATPIMFA